MTAFTATQAVSGQETAYRVNLETLYPNQDFSIVREVITPPPQTNLKRNLSWYLDTIDQYTITTHAHTTQYTNKHTAHGNNSSVKEFINLSSPPSAYFHSLHASKLALKTVHTLPHSMASAACA